MKLSKITGTAALLFLAATLPAYAQKDEKENGKEQPQHTQQAGPEARPQQARPAQQPQQLQRAPQSRPEQQAQQPRQQSQPHPQQAKAPAPEQPKPSPVRNSEQRSQPAAQQSARTPQAERAPAVAAHVQAPQAHRSSSQAQSWQQQRGWVKQGGGWQPHTNFEQGHDKNWSSDHRDWSQRGGYGGAYISQVSFGMYFGSSHFFRIGPMPLMYMGYPRFPYGGYSFLLLDPWPESWQENWYASDDVYIDYSDGYYLYDRRYPGVRLAVTVVL